MMADRRFDVVVTDLVMPGVGGLDVVRAAQSQKPPSIAIVITAHGSIPTAVEALQEGAIDYLTKPVDLFDLRKHVEAAMARQRRTQDGEGLASAPLPGLEGLVGDSTAMREVFDQLRQVAPSRATVLITGESGTGKELAARAVHRLSKVSDCPFVAAHCAALAEGLVESELFGRERGAFTGAEASSPGRFESVGDGTIFLDEVGEIPLATQTKLLRVLENREFQRVGGTQTLRCEARVVAATQRNLESEVAAGTFREDLFYRVSVVAIRMPPLRERQGDVRLLVRKFLDEFSAEGRTRISEDALELINAYRWPGNVRELRNLVERLCVLRRGGEAGVDDLPDTMAGRKEGGAVELQVGMRLDDVERRMIEETLNAVGGNRTQAAKALGVSRRTLQRKLKEEEGGE